ncbi:MAG: tetratricopeptide repeat protein [Promethearchaeota archaeon]
MVKSQSEELEEVKNLMREGKYEEALTVIKEFDNKSGISDKEKLLSLGLKGTIYLNLGESAQALDYAEKSLKIQEERSDPEGIAGSLYLIGNIHSFNGEFDKALYVCNQILEIEEPSFSTKTRVKFLLGSIYSLKGEIDRALDYYHEVLSFSKEISLTNRLVGATWSELGNMYRMKGDYDQAIKFSKLPIESTDKNITRETLGNSLFRLILIYLDLNYRKEAQRYLSQLKDLSNKVESRRFSHWYRIANALVLKASNRSSNRAEAEIILKQIVEEEDISIWRRNYALIALCEYLLEELENSNEPEILDEINHYISRMLIKSNNFAEVKLLQGRLALIQLNLNDARQYLSEAQTIADDKGLTLLAQKISNEHDNLLEELEIWESFKKTKASISKRMKLAAIDGVMEQMLGKRAIEPTKIIEEEPILLLIMDNAGNTFFNHLFAKNWDYEDLFSSFMAAFNTFSSEAFSESIDRIKMGENLILVNPIEPFLVCYVIKGQSYTALKKLNSFSEAIRNKSKIWDSLQKSIRTSEMLDFNNPPSLGMVINEIFKV